jgi:hypothetical protein
MASAQATNTIRLSSFDVVKIEAPNVASCQKLTAPTPIHKQCNGTAGQVHPAARSGSGKDDKVSFSETRHPLPLTLKPVSLRKAAYIDLALAKRRRAPFWQIFAISGRLRN